MKKILFAILFVGLLVFNYPSVATEANSVKLNLINVPLKSPLQNNYSAYRVEFVNNGQNPVRVNDVNFYNRVIMADVFGSYKLKKSTVACTLLSLPTLGLSNLFAFPDVMKNNTDILSAQNEARRFNAYEIMPYNPMNPTTNTPLTAKNEILTQGQSVQYNILVPLNENPQVAGTFFDTVSNQYVRVQNDK